MTNLKMNLLNLKSGNLQFSFLDSGDLYEARFRNIMINQLLSNPIDGSLNNLYLRVHGAEGIKAFPLLGIKSGSRFSFDESHAVWEGTIDEISYKVTLMLTDQDAWFWDITVENDGKQVDIIYGQDIGLALKGAIRTNEAFTSQYIDHSVFNDEEMGYIVCSRQNQPQDGCFPYLQQGSLTKATSYSTDGFQFYGLSYKETNQPEALEKAALADEIYQYEFAYTALKSEVVALSGSARFVFYGLIQEDHPEAVTSLECKNLLANAWQSVKPRNPLKAEPVPQVKMSEKFSVPLRTLDMTMEEVNAYFPQRHQEEWEHGQLLSFFTENHEHIVLKKKELLIERPHGHILMSGKPADSLGNVLTTTAYMYGVFNSQLTIGNTNMNKMISNTRSALNIMKTSGQRIYIEVDGRYQLLTMPSAFEMGFNYSRWFYKTEDDLLVITNFTLLDKPEVHLHVQSAAGKPYRFLVTNQVTMNNLEYVTPYEQDLQDDTLIFKAGPDADSKNTLPDLTYRMKVIGADFTVGDERHFGEGMQPQSASLTVLELEPAADWTLIVQGTETGGEWPFDKREATREIKAYQQYFKSVMNGFHLEHEDQSSIENMNDLAWWYTHNMLVHYAVPHGLEQYSGAAWGTRDVCQGPFEYFLSMQKHDTLREIIKTVFSHQYQDEGNWPQWFMFDQYYQVQQEESHGDVIVWPLKMLGDYLSATKDFSILSEKVPYTQRGSFDFTMEKESILDHVHKEIDYIQRHFLHETHLSAYGDGDWDDTLQPANAQLKQYLISSWTVALTFQAIKQLASLLEEHDATEGMRMKSLAAGIEADFLKYILEDDILPGFVYMESPEEPQKLLHPTDQNTGIQYRLLPMTRSMIAELLSPEQAEMHYQIIRKKLYHADGVRLMDRPANYRGGISTHFQRAEQAANFGREVGLHYVHAHIRFIEAMAKLGKHDEVWKGLQVINPVGIHETLPNAERRQSNSYFSSSDGKFNTRYEAQDGFDQLRDGSVPVKGGWRIYSSGPGIYMNQLISNSLGIRLSYGNLIIDPVLPPELSGLKFHFKLAGKPVTFEYHLGLNQTPAIKVNEKSVEVQPLTNRYRRGGVLIDKDILEKHLANEQNTICIYT